MPPDHPASAPPIYVMTMAVSSNRPTPVLPLVDLIPLMLEEWPQLSSEALENIVDDPEATVIYIATHTEHTRTLVRRHLEELASLRSPETEAEVTQVDPAKPLPSTIDQLLGELEDRTDQLIQDFKAEMLPELEKKARRNLGTSLLMALGFGVIVGLLLGGKRG